MELDVTHMVAERDSMIELSGSCVEHGQDAGRITWNNSKAYAAEHPLLTTDDQRDAARAHFREYGAWPLDEVSGWSEEDLQTIMCQDVDAAIREAEPYMDDQDKYQKLCEAGTLSGRLCVGDDGKWYFYLGS